MMEQVLFVLVELVVNVMFEFHDHMTKKYNSIDLLLKKKKGIFT